MQNFVILALTILDKFNPEPSYFRQLFRYNFRPDVDNDVISGVAVEDGWHGKARKKEDYNGGGLFDKKVNVVL